MKRITPPLADTGLMFDKFIVIKVLAICQHAVKYKKCKLKKSLIIFLIKRKKYK